MDCARAYKGQTTDKDDFIKNKQAYYQKIGWTKRGRPMSSVLKKLGLKDVDKALKRQV